MPTPRRWSNLPQGLLGSSGGAPSGGQSATPCGGTPPGGGGTPPSGSGSQSGGAGGGGNQARVGLVLSALNDEQLAAFTTMLKAATGTTSGLGYNEIELQLAADDYLAANGGGDTYGRGNYYVALLGSPQDSGTWEFQFGGHHLAVANTYTAGKLAGATPALRGIEPNAKFELDGKSYQPPLAVKEAAFTALLARLSSNQQASAKLSDTFTDLVLGPAPAKTGRSPPTRPERNDYVRVDGPSVWIEFSMQGVIVLSGHHPHSVWRDHTTDYGGTKS